MRVLIVDDHELMRRGVAYVVEHGFPDADVVEADDASSALVVLHESPADLALVGVHPPDPDKLELLRAMKLERPDMPVIVLSTHENASHMRRALADGAAGYLMRDATPEDLGHAINDAISGAGNVLSPRAMQALFADLASSSSTRAAVFGRRLSEYHLTQREHEILAVLPDGRSNRSIAQSLFVTEETVKAHLAAIFRKLGVTNRTQAAMLAVQLGMGPAPGPIESDDR